MPNKFTHDDLITMQYLPFETKIKKSILRIKEWYSHYNGKVCVSISGGKDSTVLLHLVRSIYPDVKAVYCDTRLAYPTYTNLIYKVLFDKNAKQLQQDYKLKKGESVRDYLSADELADVENLERLSAGLINLGWGYEQIKNFLTANVPKKMIA